MAIKRQFNFLGNQRVDVPHLRLVESAVAADFQALSGTFMSGTRALVATGAVILDTGMVGQPANTLILRMANTVLLHGTATEPGAIFTVPASQADDTLEAANANVVGSFIPGTTNYIAIDLVRTADATTQDTVVFRSSTGGEFPQIAPLGRVLNYSIVVSTSPFGANGNLCPVAKVVTDVNNNITSITDCRQMFFRLGTGGTSPDTLAQYAWGNRNEVVSTSGFTGGDKDIASQFAFNGAVLQRLWELGGGEHWYSPADDRSVKLVYTVASPWSWDGTDLTWSGLKFVFGNSTAEYNWVTDQPGAFGGTTDLADGEVIYVELDRTNNGVTLPTYKVARTWLFSNPPVLPGTRQILAWREGAQVFAGDANNDVTVTVPLPIASPIQNGGVKLNHASTTPLDPKVPVVNASNWAVADGLDTNAAGPLSIGTVAANSLTFAQAGVTSTFDGELDTTQGLVATQAVVNGNAITGTGNGTGAGVYGVGGATNAPGVRGLGTGTGAGVYGEIGASGLYGVYGTGAGATTDGTGVYGLGKGNGRGVEGLGGNGVVAFEYDCCGVKGVGGTTALSCGVWGSGGSTSGHGVIGFGTGGQSGVHGRASFATNASGVTGTGDGTAPGVYGLGGNGVGGNGVLGVSGTTDGTYGVRGTGGGTTLAHGVGGYGSGTGKGVIGTGGGAVGGGDGVYGSGTGTGGNGVVGIANDLGSGGVFSSTNGPGIKVASNATKAAIHIDSYAGDPSTTTAGDIWYNSVAGSFKCHTAAGVKTITVA